MDPAPSDDWEALLPRLLLWAQRLHARTLADVRGAPTPADLVQDAITDALTGRRTRPDDVPMGVFLYNVIRSRVSATLGRAKTRGEATTARYVGLEEAERVHHEATTHPDREALRSRVLALVDGDEVLCRIVALWFEDPGLKAADLAEMLHLPAREVYAAARRLRRTNVTRAALGLDSVEFALLAWRNAAVRRPLYPTIRF